MHAPCPGRSPVRWYIVRRAAGTACATGAIALAAAGAHAQSIPSKQHPGQPAVTPQRHTVPLGVTISPVQVLRTSPDGIVGGPAPRGPGCPQTVSSHTDASFTGGQYVVQAGFAETEIAAASYVLPAGAFPIKVDLMEMIFATSNATEQTVTQWSIIVWDGTPATGAIVAQYSSDDVILPHIRLSPGTQAVDVQVSVEPNDPDQIIVSNNGGTNTFSIGYRIDHHNQQSSNPCFTSPPTCCNAFPCTDVSGLSQPTRNWLFGVNCGPFGCPPNGGWSTFANLASFCRPSGDWVMRATWESVNCTPVFGACCMPNGTCNLQSQSACATAGGLYRGDNSTCANANCPQPTQACCFPSTGGCLNLDPANCTAAGGTPGGVGTACATYVCFPMGACCLPNGSCVGPVSPSACTAQGGTFRGNGTTCASQNCPLPQGACCTATGFCLVLSQPDCATAGGTWRGEGTNCSGPNPCAPVCPCDWNHANGVNSQDFFDFLTSFFAGNADFNHDNTTNSQDFFDFLTCFFTPPAGC